MLGMALPLPKMTDGWLASSQREGDGAWSREVPTERVEGKVRLAHTQARVFSAVLSITFSCLLRCVRREGAGRVQFLLPHQPPLGFLCDVSNNQLCLLHQFLQMIFSGTGLTSPA